MATDRPATAGRSPGLIVGALLALGAVLVVLFLPDAITSRSRGAVEDGAVDLVTVTAGLAAPALLQEGDDAVQQVVDSVAAIPEVTYVVVGPAAGSPRAAWSPERAVDLGTSQGVLYAEDMLHLVARVPGAEPATHVQVGYALTSIVQARQQGLRLAGGLASLLLLAAVVAGSASLGGASGATEASGIDPDERTASVVTGDEFLAYISHELRTPLNAILGYSEMLQEDAVFLDQTDFVPDLKKIQKAGQHLIALVDDIVALSRVYSGNMDIDVESFPVRALVDEVQRGVKPLLARTLVNLDVKVSPAVREMTADRGKLVRALDTVVREAAGLTGQGELMLEVSQRSGGDEVQVVFRVVNPQGQLTEEEIQGLVRDFSGEKARSLPQFHGAGLGLIISREFCRVQRGDLAIRSSPGKGTTFEMVVPEQVARRAASAAA